jgi:hypothetical protein
VVARFFLPLLLFSLLLLSPCWSISSIFIDVFFLFFFVSFLASKKKTPSSTFLQSELEPALVYSTHTLLLLKYCAVVVVFYCCVRILHRQQHSAREGNFFFFFSGTGAGIEKPPAADDGFYNWIRCRWRPSESTSLYFHVHVQFVFRGGRLLLLLSLSP